MRPLFNCPISLKIIHNIDIVRHNPKVSSQYLQWFPSNKLLHLWQTDSADIIPFKTPSAEKKLAALETQASKVNISQKVRHFCGIHIKCINITKKVRSLLMCFKKQWPGKGEFHVAPSWMPMNYRPYRPNTPQNIRINYHVV